MKIQTIVEKNTKSQRIVRQAQHRKSHINYQKKLYCIVLRNLHHSTQTTMTKTALDERGFKVVQIMTVLNRVPKNLYKTSSSYILKGKVTMGKYTI